MRTAIDSRKFAHVKNPKLVNSRKLIYAKNRFFKIFIRMQLILLSTKAAISMTVNSVFIKFIFLFKKTIIYCYFLSLTTFLFVSELALFFFTGIIQRFGLLFQNTYFKEQLLMVASVVSYKTVYANKNARWVLLLMPKLCNYIVSWLATSLLKIIN